MRFLVLILAGLLLCAAPGWGAWGTGNATCSAQSETAADLTCTVGTENLEAGNIAVVVCATNNVSINDGESNGHVQVTDSAGNSYTKLKEWTEGTGGIDGGATVSLHAGKLTTTLSSGAGTITCDTNQSAVDHAMHLVGEFTVGTGNSFEIAGTPQGENSNGGDAGTLTISGLTSGEYLFVRGIAAESNAVTSMTATPSHSLPDDPSDGCNGTTGGGEASDMAACSEYRIFTGTGDSSNPTLADTTNDNASVYVALQETAPPAGGSSAPRRTFISQRLR